MPPKKKTEPELRRIAIVGFTEHRKYAPWDDDGWEKWGLNNLHTVIGEEQTNSCARWFNLHTPELITKDTVHVEWARDYCRVPYYTFDTVDFCDTNVLFPAREMIERFGSNYFTNSISWMIALAMRELEPALIHWRANRPEDPQAAAEWDGVYRPIIGIWGVDMAATTEYANQRPSCEYWIGVAQGLGYFVSIAEGSDLLQAATMYGMGDDSPLRRKLEFRLTEHQQAIATLQAKRAEVAGQLGQIDGQIASFQGAISELQYIHGIWTTKTAESTRGTENEDG